MFRTLFAMAGLLLPGTLLGQGLVSGVVRDPSGAVIDGAPAVLSQGGNDRTALTSSSGEFRFADVPPGRYELSIAVAGFDPIRRTVQVRSGPGRSLEIDLKLASVKEQLTVAAQSAEVAVAADRNAATISVERSMLDNIPVLDGNFLNAVSRFLNPGTPGDGGTTLIVDGVEARNTGMTASAIQEIRINNNPYTAEYPRWSRRRIEVITKSSADQFHGTFNFLFRDYHLNAREALAAQRPQEQRRIYEGSLFGPVGKSKKMSFLLSGARQDEDLVAVVVARTLRGAVNENVPTQQINTTGSLRVTREITKSQAMFWQVNFQDRWQNNTGVGGTTLAEAGAQARFREDEFIVNHRAVITPKVLSEFRILIGRYWSPTHSNLNAPRVTVTDAFTGGGAQADRLSTEFHTSLAWMITQTWKGHNIKFGFSVPDWSRRGLRDETNRIGSLSFASLADYSTGQPFAAALQRGETRLIFIEKNVGGFFQDEWQFRPNLSIAAGVRYDWQNYFGDNNNFAPRLSIAYAPDKARKWVIRTGAGSFFDRSGPGPISDTLRFDGVRLRRYVLMGSQIPQNLDAFSGIGMPTSIHRLQPGIQLPTVIQFSAGFERQLSKKTLLAATYIGTRGTQQLRSRDANAPLPPMFAARPNPGLNVLRQIESAGRFEGNALEVTLRGDIAPRVTGTLQYTLSKTMANTGGVNWYPASSFAPQGEWGRSDTDRRHQFGFLGTANLHRWVNLGFSVSAATGAPFNITTGRDDNRDGLAADRPAGINRNAGLGPEMVIFDLRWSREFRLQAAKKDKSPSLTFSLDAFNILNRVNYQNYVGSLSSPFYGQAVATQPARRLQAGLRLQF